MVGDTAYLLVELQNESQELRDYLKMSQGEVQKLTQRVDSFIARQTPIPGDGSHIQLSASSTPTSSVSSVTPTTPIVQLITPFTVLLAPPERFFGDPSKFAVFMSQCSSHFSCKP